jgi:hypothetical protein
MESNQLAQMQALITRDFEMEPAESEKKVTEEELLQLLADRISWLIEYRMEYLLSLLYRLDVKEEKVDFSLSPACPDPANIALAKLVLERQKERIRTKHQYKQDEIDGWEW